MKYLLISLICCLTYCISGQTEIELRTDGIVIPRLDTSAVVTPTIGQVIYNTGSSQLMYFDGSIWSTISGPFERSGTVIRQRDEIDTDDFVFGRADLPQDGFIDDQLFFFDQSKGAFRGGLMDDNGWVEDSLGSFSFGYGFNTRASRTGSVAMGYNSIASGDVSTAIGSHTEASGAGATAIGIGPKASGLGAVAIGHLSNASGAQGATAFGYSTNASGDYGATALGNYSEASGSYGATALGYSTKATGNSGATAIGIATIATGNSCIVVGRFNDTLVTAGTVVTDSSPLFIVGNGDDFGSESNALTVFKNGKVGIGTNTPSSQLHLSYDSKPGDGQLKLTEEDSDGARIIFENDKRNPKWTIYGQPSALVSTSFISFRYNEGQGNPSNKFQIFGNGDATLAGMLTQNSDRRLKTNIKKVENALGIIHKIGGYTYNWISDSQNTRNQIGVIAQEVQKVLPEIVKADNEGILSVSYSSLIPVLIEGMKEQQDLIDMQEQELNRQKGINTEYEKRISKLESLIYSKATTAN